jgi:TonB family protein
VGQSIRALDICGELEVSAQFTIMTFNPDANLNTLRTDLAFMRRFAGNPLNFCRAEIYAGTPLEKRMIALGRARGDYRAREYSMYDPVADLACTISLDLFYDRCWGDGSLMQKSIGLDHMIAVRKRFNGRDDLCERAHAWVRTVNLDTLNLLEEVIELSASGMGKMDADALRKVQALKEREVRARNQLLLQGLRLKIELDEFRLPSRPVAAGSTPRFRLSRQVAVAVLALGVQATLASGPGMAEQTAAATQQAGSNQEKCCTLGGAVTDATGAAVVNASITITNAATKVAVTLATDKDGQFTAKDLESGKYEVSIKANGFKTTVVNGVEVTAGKAARLDIRLEIGDWGGCCEYAAAPMRTSENYLLKNKPFGYEVGEARDGGTLRGVAKLVYGDEKMWIWIYEANRDEVGDPNGMLYGMSLTIPLSRPPVPKVETKILPSYPEEAVREQVHGEVAMDVTLNDDGTVQEVKVIEGNPLLDNAATGAVKQWKYRPLTVHGKPVDKFVVVITFEKSGKVR